MKDDPIVAEVRRIRQEHAARFDYDLDLIVEDLKAQEQASGRQYIRLPPPVVWLSRRRSRQRRPISSGPSAARLSSATRTPGRCWG